MIERKFVMEKIKEIQIQSYVKSTLRNVGLSKVKVQRTPLGEKVLIYTSRPGLVVGRKGQNIKQLTKTLKSKFEMENPQIEIAEIENMGLNAVVMAENIAGYLERFGTKNFKGIGHKIMTQVMGSGALGVEIILSGKIPSSRAKSWRFYSGYLRKCGDIAIEGVDHAYAVAHMKSGAVGIKVSIMPPDIQLPDNIELREEAVEEVKEEEIKEEKESKKEKKKDIKESKSKDKKEVKEKKTKKEEKPKEDKKEEEPKKEKETKENNDEN
jgi:small subunit ribosomal protein S3